MLSSNSKYIERIKRIIALLNKLSQEELNENIAKERKEIITSNLVEIGIFGSDQPNPIRKEILNTLLEIMNKTTDNSILFHVIQGLQYLDDVRANTSLKKMLKDRNLSVDVKSQILYILIEYTDDTEAMDLVLKVLTESPDLIVYFLDSLSKINNINSYRMILLFLETDRQKVYNRTELNLVTLNLLKNLDLNKCNELEPLLLTNVLVGQSKGQIEVAKKLLNKCSDLKTNNGKDMNIDIFY